VTVEADNVAIDGFKLDLRDATRDGINTRTANVAKPGDSDIGAYRENISILNNWIVADYTLGSQKNALLFGESTTNQTQSVNAEIENVTIRDNYINLVTTSESLGPRGIVFTNMFRDNGASLVYTNVVVENNTVFSTYQTILEFHLQSRMEGAKFEYNLIGNSRSGPSLPSLYNSTFSHNTIQDINPGTDIHSNQSGAILGVVGSTVSGNTFQRIGGTAALVLAGGRDNSPYFPAST
jgi:hypothetical protein